MNPTPQAVEEAVKCASYFARNSGQCEHPTHHAGILVLALRESREEAAKLREALASSQAIVEAVIDENRVEYGPKLKAALSAYLDGGFQALAGLMPRIAAEILPPRRARSKK